MERCQPRDRRYRRQLLTAALVYVGVLFASVYLLRTVAAEWPAALRALLALAPLLPVGLMARAMVAGIRDSDEFQRQLQLEAAAVAGLVIGLGYFSLALLAKAGLLTLDPVATAVWVFPGLCLAFGLAKYWLGRSYHE
ncbi:MAG TPA: hypothetical protein VFY12_11800 [Arenimonas sp.]|nr:hypothetical protein [Arenimonas sp.]